MIEQKQKHQQEEEKTRKKLLLLLLLLLLVLGAFVGWWFLRDTEPAGLVIGGFPGFADASDIDPETLRNLAEDHLDATTTMITIFPDVLVESDGQTGLLWLQNSPNNEFGQHGILRLAETDEIIFESGVILPGYQINQITLARPLTSGTHSAIMELEFYDLDTQAHLGNTTVDVRIIVE